METVSTKPPSREDVLRKIDVLAASIGMLARLQPAFLRPHELKENMDRRIEWLKRLSSYTQRTGFPESLMIGADGRVVGTWILGNDYRVKSGYYGGYPATYLKRVAALFPEKKRVLHLFSGRVDLSVMPGDTVDISPHLGATFVDDAQTLERVPLTRYDLVLADPPYSVEDAGHYGASMIRRKRVFDALHRLKRGTHLVILDQVLWQWRKDVFDLEAVIGIVRSTNHRFRVVTVFRRK